MLLKEEKLPFDLSIETPDQETAESTVVDMSTDKVELFEIAPENLPSI
jgi:antitoxin component of RelBE/YafQ-DinJ toxin-antitoxin module